MFGTRLHVTDQPPEGYSCGEPSTNPQVEFIFFGDIAIARSIKFERVTGLVLADLKLELRLPSPFRKMQVVVIRWRLEAATESAGTKDRQAIWTCHSLCPATGMELIWRQALLEGQTAASGRLDRYHLIIGSKYP